MTSFTVPSSNEIILPMNGFLEFYFHLDKLILQMLPSLSPLKKRKDHNFKYGKLSLVNLYCRDLKEHYVEDPQEEKCNNGSHVSAFICYQSYYPTLQFLNVLARNFAIYGVSNESLISIKMSEMISKI